MPPKKKTRDGSPRVKFVMNTRRTTRDPLEQQDQASPVPGSSTDTSSAQTSGLQNQKKSNKTRKKKGAKKAASSSVPAFEPTSTSDRFAATQSQGQIPAQVPPTSEDETTGSKRKRKPRKTVGTDNIYDATSSESSEHSDSIASQNTPGQHPRAQNPSLNLSQPGPQSQSHAAQQASQSFENAVASEDEDEPIGKTARTVNNDAPGKAKKDAEPAVEKETKKASGVRDTKKKNTKATKGSNKKKQEPLVTTQVSGGQIVTRHLTGNQPQANVPPRFRTLLPAPPRPPPPTAYLPQAGAQEPVSRSPFPSLQQARAYDPPQLPRPGDASYQHGQRQYFTEEQRRAVEAQERQERQPTPQYGHQQLPLANHQQQQSQSGHQHQPQFGQGQQRQPLPQFGQQQQAQFGRQHQPQFGQQQQVQFNQQQQSQGNQQVAPAQTAQANSVDWASAAIPAHRRTRGALLEALAGGDAYMVAQIQKVRADELSEALLMRNRRLAEAEGRSPPEPPPVVAPLPQNILEDLPEPQLPIPSVEHMVQYHVPAPEAEHVIRGIPSPEHGEVVQPLTREAQHMDMDMDIDMDDGGSPRDLTPQMVAPADLHVDPALYGAVGPDPAPYEAGYGAQFGPQPPQATGPERPARCLHLSQFPAFNPELAQQQRQQRQIDCENRRNNQDVDMTDWTPWQGMSNEEASRQFGQLSFPDAPRPSYGMRADSQQPEGNNTPMHPWPSSSQDGNNGSDVAREASQYVEDALLNSRGSQEYSSPPDYQVLPYYRG